jgi:hypothetical protein
MTSTRSIFTGGLEKVEAEYALGALDRRRDVGNRQTRRVRREHRVVLDVPLDLLEEVAFQLQILGYGLDDQAGVSDCRVKISRRVDPVENLVGRLVESVLLFEFLKTPGNLLAPLLEELLSDVAHRHLVSCHRGHLRDSVTHITGTQYGSLLGTVE